MPHNRGKIVLTGSSDNAADAQLRLPLPPSRPHEPGPTAERRSSLGWGRGVRVRLRENLEIHWPWVVLIVTALVTLAFVWGYLYADFAVTKRFVVASPTLPATPAGNDALAPGAFLQRLGADMRTREFAAKVTQASPLRIHPETLDANSAVTVDTASGEVTVRLYGPFTDVLVAAAKTYVALGQQRATELWDQEVRRRRLALEQQLARMDRELNEVKRSLQNPKDPLAVVDAEREYADALTRKADLESKATTLLAQREANRVKVESLAEELRKQNPSVTGAREALNQALSQFTEEHPKVKALRAALAQLEVEAATGSWVTNTGILTASNPVTVGLYLRYVELKTQIDATAKEVESLRAARDGVERRLAELLPMSLAIASWRSQYQSLVEIRNTLLKHHNEVLLKENQPVISQNVLDLTRTDNISTAPKWRAGFRFGAGFGFLGAFCCTLVLMWRPVPERCIGSIRDLEMTTQLPVLASLDDLEAMDDATQETWACETLASLKAQLCGSQKGMMLSFVSSLPREGKSTWIRLLARAADRQGYRVVVVSNEPSFFRPQLHTDSPHLPPALSVVPTDYAWDVMGDAVARGAEGPVCIPLAEWMWNWQHREQFQQALANSCMIDNLALFVELPAYSTPGGVTLAERIPNLIWLCRQGHPGRQKTRAQLATLRLSGGGMAGAVFNRAGHTERRRHSAPLAAALVLLLGLMLGSVQAQNTNVTVVTAIGAAKPVTGLSASSPDQLADWQKRLTLGPGDVLNIALYGQADGTRSGLIIGPDGRINYLQARDVMAAGLTVEELRAELEKTLGKFHLSPQVVINPVAYRSKKYYLMGNVQGKGIHPLDRPTTIIEAIAKAKGFITAQQYQNVALMVDLPRSFVVRQNLDGSFGRVVVDFEGLFLRGDLTQNIALAPDDFLFFPPPGQQEVYVVGEVRGPGVVPFSKDLTTLGAVVVRGGFTEKAWQTKVLVIRGSLSSPEAHVVNVADILKAKGTDFKLANRDIVYVHSKPWAKAEELLEAGILTFAQASVTAFTGNKVGPFIKHPWLH